MSWGVGIDQDYLDGNYELDPHCFKDKVSFAVTNRGHLIPCCMCDDPKTMADPEFQKLLAVLKINEFESIIDILKQEEWLQFFKNLKKNKGPYACYYTCRKSRLLKNTQVVKVMDPKTGEVVDRVER